MGRPAKPRTPRNRKRKPRPQNVIFGRERQRTTHSREKGGWSATLSIDRPLAYDVDVRPLVAWISTELAAYFSEQQNKGQEPDGSRVPNVTSWTKVVSGKNRKGQSLMMRTGFGADHWWMGAIRGHQHKAERTLKPFGGSLGPKPPKGGAGRDLLWNIMLKRGYDPQSVTGRSKLIVADVLKRWLETTTGESPGIDAKIVDEVLLPQAEEDFK